MGRFCEFFLFEFLFYGCAVVLWFCFGLMWDAFSFVRCPVIVSL